VHASVQRQIVVAARASRIAVIRFENGVINFRELTT